MYNRLIQFIDQFNIINGNQFGFWKNYSTSLAINTFVNKFHEAIENDPVMISLFIDLSRAFDTLSHKSCLTNYINMVYVALPLIG